MQKYEHFKKISKTQGCSFYCAQNKQTLSNVLIKRLPQKQSWDHLLNNKNLIYSNKQKMFLKYIQIFKRKNNFFIVTQSPNGPPLTQPQAIGKLSPNRFYPIFSHFLKNLNQLLKFQPNATVQLQWLFFHHNSIKIGHFQPFFQINSNDPHSHVYLYHLQSGQPKQDNYLPQKSSEIFHKNSNLMFVLGCLAYNLLTGRPSIKGQTQQQYQQSIALLSQHAQRRIMKACNDQKLSQMIGRIVGKDLIQAPTLEQLKNFTDRKAKQVQPLPKAIDSFQVEFEMQKIKLNKSKLRLKKKKKFLRPCCRTQEDQVQFQQHNQTTHHGNNVQRNYHNLTYSNQIQHLTVAPKTRNLSLLPFISPKINQSPLKRNSILFQTNLNKPLMFTNGYRYNRQL